MTNLQPVSRSAGPRALLRLQGAARLVAPGIHAREAGGHHIHGPKMTSLSSTGRGGRRGFSSFFPAGSSIEAGSARRFCSPGPAPSAPREKTASFCQPRGATWHGAGLLMLAPAGPVPSRGRREMQDHALIILALCVALIALAIAVNLLGIME